MSILQTARNKISLKSLAEEGAIDANLIQRQAKVENVAVYMQIKKDNPELKNNDICAAMGISASTMRRTRKDLAVTSPYRYDIPTRKTKKQNESQQTTKVQPVTTKPKPSTATPKDIFKKPKKS